MNSLRPTPQRRNIVKHLARLHPAGARTAREVAEANTQTSGRMCVARQSLDGKTVQKVCGRRSALKLELRVRALVVAEL